MSFNIAALPQDQRQQIQQDYEAALWAHKVKFGKLTRDEVVASILQKPRSQQQNLTQRFYFYLNMNVKNKM